MVETLANLSLETLRDLLVEETKFLLSVSGDVEQVKRDLRSMHALLMRADRERRDSPTLKEYVSQLKDLAFKAETVIEKYAVKVGFQRSLKEKLQRYICIMCECYNIHDVGKDTREIISSLSQLKNSLESEIGQESSSRSTHQQDLARQEFSHEVEHHFVGMAKDIEILVSMVKDESRRQRVVKIYGMGGLGKTTLARKIYNHGDFQSYAQAWVCITQQFQPKAILARILKQLDSRAHNDSMDVSELVEGIHRFLEQKEKCLIVLDDIWENDHWDIIKKAFPKNCNGLLTTRSESIAHQECGHPHKLGYLTEEEGWDLLQKIAIPEDVGRGMATSSSDMKSHSVSKNDKTRRCWSHKEEEILITALKEVVAQGWKSDNGFRPGYLKRLEDSMKKEFPGTDLKGMPHINSKLSTWKKNYYSLSQILSRSGVGFNLKGNYMIDCDNDLWDQIVKSDNNARLMRFKSWPFFDDWKEIFGKDRATGENAEDIMQAVNEMLQEDDIQAGGIDGDYHVNLEDILPNEAAENSVCQSEKGDQLPRKLDKKRKAVDGLQSVCDMLGEISRNTNARLENLASRIGYEFDLGKARKEVFDLMGNIPGLSLDDKFQVCEILVDKVERLELFMGLPDSARPHYVMRLLKSKGM